MIHADPLHYNPTQGAEIPITKIRVEGQNCLVEPTSPQLGSTTRCIIFMVHGVEPLVEIGGQQQTNLCFTKQQLHQCLKITKFNLLNYAQVKNISTSLNKEWNNSHNELNNNFTLKTINS
jgi:hypothetical protein